MKILLLAIVVVLLISPLARCVASHLHLVGIYSVIDVVDYIRHRRWNEFNLYGIDMYIGMFGHGKTLSMTHRARNLYAKYGDSIRFISNYELTDIPYIPLINFNQLVDLGEEAESDYVGTVVLIDEIENVLSHRNYANFPLALLHTLTQQRKKHVFIMCSAQRFFMVDKLFRSITTNVINCNKFWRFQHCEIYDAWDLENAQNYSLIKRHSNMWWFVKNQDFNSYNTEQMVSKQCAEDFISNDESLVRKGMDLMVNDKAIPKSHQSRSLRRENALNRKNMKKG